MNKQTPPKTVPELLGILVEQNIPKAEFPMHVYRFLDCKARSLGIPMHGHFELTPLCNLDCKMCYIHLSPSQFSPDRLLPVETWKDIMRQAHAAGMLSATLSGGECLTYPKFDDLYLFLINMGIRPGLLTNGLLMNESRIAFLKKYPPKVIQVTLYGTSDDDYEAVTGHRVFETVWHHLTLLRDANLPVMITLTPNSFMPAGLKPLLQAAESLNIPWQINSRLLQPHRNTGRQTHDLCNEQYLELYRFQSELHHRALTPANPDSLPPENRPDSCSTRTGLLCGGGRSSFSIQYTGLMAPCTGLYDLTVDPLTLGFMEAWRQLRSLVDHYPIPAECPDCVYHDHCILCPAFHRNSAPGHCDPDICARTKLLVRNGLIPVPHTKGTIPS